MATSFGQAKMTETTRNQNGSIHRVLTVGISGVTCGGKSSLTSLLKAAFPGSVSVCQDDYYRKNTCPWITTADGESYENWDAIECIDMDRMTRDVFLAAHSPNRFVIVEGFSIFGHPPLVELCDLKYFITLPLDVCLTRRSARIHRDPPDPPGYFLKVVWPSHLAHLELIKRSNGDNIHYLDGTVKMEENLRRVKQDVQRLLDNM